MPLSGSEFEKNRIDVAHPLIGVFDQDRDKAFSIRELHELLLSQAIEIRVELLEELLFSLEERSWIQSKIIEGEVYFMRRKLGYLR